MKRYDPWSLLMLAVVIVLAVAACVRSIHQQMHCDDIDEGRTHASFDGTERCHEGEWVPYRPPVQP